MEKEGVMKVFIYLTWIFLFVTGIADLFINPYRSIIWALSLAVLLFLYFRVKVPLYMHLLFSFIVLLNVFGETIFEWYYLFIHYDKLLHLINPVIGCLFIYHLVKNKIRDKKMLMMFCVFAVISIAIGWEISEFGFDKLTNYGMQGVKLMDGGHFFLVGEVVMPPFDDTMLDLICDVAGALVFGLVFWIKNIKNKGKRKARKHS